MHYLAVPACALHMQQELRVVNSLVASRRSVFWCSRVCASLHTREILSTFKDFSDSPFCF